MTSMSLRGGTTRKRKSPAPAGVKAKKARKSEMEVAEDEIAAGGMGDYCSRATGLIFSSLVAY